MSKYLGEKTVNPYKYSLATRLKASHIVNFLNVSPGEKLLDVGCGLGYFVQLLKQRNACRLFGLDICFESLASAKRVTSLYFLNSSATKVAAKDSSFDKILISGKEGGLVSFNGSVTLAVTFKVVFDVSLTGSARFEVSLVSLFRISGMPGDPVWFV